MGSARESLRAPSPLHAFNRYEIKYLVHVAHAERARAAARGGLDLDRYAGDGGYGVWSVYYDTPELRFYWEKIEGLRFRRKLRMRHYGDRSHDRRRHARSSSRSSSGSTGSPRSAGSRCRTGWPAAVRRPGAWSSTSRGSAASSRRSSAWSAGWTCGPVADHRLPARGLRRPRRRRRACGSPWTTGSAAGTATSTSAPTPRTGSSSRRRWRCWRSRPTSGCRTG